MANPEPTLVDDLKSLRIEREKPARELPRWLAPAVAAAALAVLVLLAWKVLAPQLLMPEVETTTVALVSPPAGAARGTRRPPAPARPSPRGRLRSTPSAWPRFNSSTKTPNAPSARQII
jgi:hypothetical protein